MTIRGVVRSPDYAQQYAQFAALVLEVLDEAPGSEAHALVTRCVAVLGPVRVHQLCDQARHIYERGGINTADNERKRTPGGIFFLLVKASTTGEQYAAIFQRSRQQRTGQPGRRTTRTTISAYGPRFTREVPSQRIRRSGLSPVV
jgi:PHAX RNA-binding domain